MTSRAWFGGETDTHPKVHGRRAAWVEDILQRFQEGNMSMINHSQPLPVPPHADACFQHLVDLTIPNDCRTELVVFPETPTITEVLVWQHGKRLFSLRFSPDQTHQVIASWQ